MDRCPKAASGRERQTLRASGRFMLWRSEQNTPPNGTHGARKLPILHLKSRPKGNSDATESSLLPLSMHND